jgi:predicted nucleic acid-binding protein
LLDTNVISEARKKRPDPYVLAWIASIRSADIFLSVLTIGEIRIGIERLRRRDPDRAADLSQWLAGLCAAYADRIVEIDTRVAEEWALLNVPDPVRVIDGLLAATARCHGWTLVTRNTADLARTGVPLLNPFEPAA